MKIIIFLVCIFSITLSHATSKYNAMVIDSAFPPLKRDNFSIGDTKCILLNENNKEVPFHGNCYNIKEWNNVKSKDVDVLKGILDFYAKKQSHYSNTWKDINKNHPQQAKQVRNNFILSSHGTRSAYLIFKHSDQQAKILPVRVITTQAGLTKQNSTFSGKQLYKQKYNNGCGLINWTDSQVNQFEQGRLQPYQERIQKALTNNQGIKVINISLGYKYSWIKEDNPKCSTGQIDKEFKVLKGTWNNLISKFPDRLFFVAAGNENQNFDNPIYGNDDLWSVLSSLPNLVIVGSTTLQGFKYKSSNWGKNVDVMAQGEDIDVFSPIPLNQKGHATTLRGTSFSTPQVAGLAIPFFKKGKSI